MKSRPEEPAFIAENPSGESSGGATVTAATIGKDELLPYLADWVTAKTVAKKMGLPWRPVAWALRRLVERHEIEDRVVEVRGTARSVEHQRLYRVKVAWGTEYPDWLVPKHPLPEGRSRVVKAKG